MFRKRAPDVSARTKVTYIQINCRLRPVRHTHLGKLYQGPGRWRTADPCAWHWKRSTEGQLAPQQELQEGRREAKVSGSGAGQGRAGPGRAGQQDCGEGATVKSTLGVAHMSL